MQQHGSLSWYEYILSYNELTYCEFVSALVAAYANCSLFCIKAEEDIPVPRREYDDLALRHSQLQDEYVNLWPEFDTLRAENEKLKEELQKSNFSYATVQCNIRQLVFFTGLTSVILEWLFTKTTGSVERISQALGCADEIKAGPK